MRSCSKQTSPRPLPWCEAGHTTYLEATGREEGEKQSTNAVFDEKACRNYLWCWLINSDQILSSGSETNLEVCICNMRNSCQDQQEQAGQGPEHGPASHPWSHENHPSAWHGKNSQCRATGEGKKPQDPHLNWESHLHSFYIEPWHSPPTITSKTKAWTTSTAQETSGLGGSAGRAADTSCVEARWWDRHSNIVECPRHHLCGTAPWRTQKPELCHWQVCWGRTEEWWQQSVHQVARWWHRFSLSSLWPSLFLQPSQNTGHLAQ